MRIMWRGGRSERAPGRGGRRRRGAIEDGCYEVDDGVGEGGISGAVRWRRGLKLGRGEAAGHGERVVIGVRCVEDEGGVDSGNFFRRRDVLEIRMR